MATQKFGVGQSVRRKEDDPLLRGAGRYIADHSAQGTLHAVIVRSPHAHARFKLDAATARAMPGVRLVLTGDDVADVARFRVSPAFRVSIFRFRSIRCWRALRSGMSATPWPLLWLTRSSRRRMRLKPLASRGRR